MPELLAVRGLSVDFVTDGGVARVLDAITLDVGAGEVVGLVGESGCGKTTLARAILGILPAGAARLPAGAGRRRHGATQLSRSRRYVPDLPPVFSSSARSEMTIDRSIDLHMS